MIRSSLVLPLLVFICLAVVASSSSVQAAVIIRGDGSLDWETRGEVLGKDSNLRDDEEKENSSGSGSSGPSSGSPSKTEESKTETILPDGTRVRTEVKESGEVESEVRFGEESRVKTRFDEDRRRVEVIEGGVKVRLEQKDGRFRVKVENEDGQTVAEVEPEGEELLRIEERLDKGVIRIATASAGRFTVARNNLTATTAFPLSVDLTTNQLTVTTPAGPRVVAVLPDQAVKNMLAAQAVDRVGGLEFVEVVRQASPSPTFAQAVTLVADRLGQPVYVVAGLKTHRLLGFLPISLPRTVTVSAETGALTEVRQSLWARLVDFLSPN